MYPKREAYFTAIVVLAVSWHLGSPQAVIRGEGQGVVASFRDGTHPPPPPQPLLVNTEMFRADGTHPPPPPPPLAKAETLQADGTHPPPPPWLTNSLRIG